MRHGTSARSNFSVIPARVSGAREESRIPLEDVGKDRDSSRGQPRARMAEQEIERDRNCHYDLQRLSWLGISLLSLRGWSIQNRVVREESGWAELELVPHRRQYRPIFGARHMMEADRVPEHDIGILD